MSERAIEQTQRPIFIGSRRRPDFPVQQLFYGATLFVEPQELARYRFQHGDRYTIVPLGKDDGGFGYLLNQMQAYARERGLAHWLFCDDDVLGYRRRDRLRVPIDEIYDALERTATERHYAQVMCGFSGHTWYQKQRIKERIGAWCLVLNDTGALDRVGGYDEELAIFNDWEISARLLTRGFQTACLYDYYFEHRMKSREGGASDIYRHQQLLTDAIARLRAKYGDRAVRTVEAHGQTEARFNWSKLPLIESTNLSSGAN